MKNKWVSLLFRIFYEIYYIQHLSEATKSKRKNSNSVQQYQYNIRQISDFVESLSKNLVAMSLFACLVITDKFELNHNELNQNNWLNSNFYIQVCPLWLESASTSMRSFPNWLLISPKLQIRLTPFHNVPRFQTQSRCFQPFWTS